MSPFTFTMSPFTFNSVTNTRVRMIRSSAKFPASVAAVHVLASNAVK